MFQPIDGQINRSVLHARDKHLRHNAVGDNRLIINRSAKARNNQQYIRLDKTQQHTRGHKEPLNS